MSGEFRAWFDLNYNFGGARFFLRKIKNGKTSAAELVWKEVAEGAIYSPCATFPDSLGGMEELREFKSALYEAIAEPEVKELRKISSVADAQSKHINDLRNLLGLDCPSSTRSIKVERKAAESENGS